MQKQKEQIRALKEQINAKVDEAVGFANEGELAKAQDIQAQIEELGNELSALEDELKQLEVIANTEKLEVEAEEVPAENAEEEEAPAEEPVEEASEEEVPAEEVIEAEEEEEKRNLIQGEDEKMVNLNEFNKGNNNQEVRSDLNAFLRTKGAEKRGLKIVDAGAVIPQEFITTPQETPQTIVDLRKYANVVKVSHYAGSMPVLAVENEVMASTAELEANPALANPSFTDITYRIDTYRGFIPVSQEALDDADVDLAGIVSKAIQKKALNTSNAQIASVAKTFTAKTVADLDGLKDIVNVELDPAYNVKFIVSQSFFNEVDKMKDKDGRYLLQSDITVASGYKLFGREVVILKDEVIGTASGDKVAFVGDLEHGVAFFDRQEVFARWVDNDIYGQKLAGFVRFDVQKADADAGFYVTLADSVGTEG